MLTRTLWRSSSGISGQDRCRVESEELVKTLLCSFLVQIVSYSSFRIPRSRRIRPSRLSVATPGHILTDGTEKENKINPPFPQPHTVRYQSGVFLKGVWITASVSKDQSMLDTDK